MTAAPQNGEEEDLQLFMALLDGDRFEGRFGDRFYVTNVSDLMRRLWISLGMGYEHGNQHPTFVKVPTCPSFLGIPNRRRAMTDSTPCGGRGTAYAAPCSIATKAIRLPSAFANAIAVRGSRVLPS